MSEQKRSSFGRASALMASGSLVSRVLGVVRYAMLYACVGAQTGASTAFQTANVLPNTIFMLLSGGLLTAILIPQITKRMGGSDEDNDAIDSLLTLSFGIVAIVTIISTLAAAPLITLLQLQGAVRDLGVLFAYICLPQIFFYGAYVIWGQVLNTRGRFGEYMWSPVLANIVQIVGMAFFIRIFGRVPEATGWTAPMIWLLAGTTTLGIVVQALGLLPALKRSGFTWRPNFRLRGYGFRSAARVAAWTITAVIIAQVGGFITQQAINHSSEGARLDGDFVANISIYLQSFTIFMVPIGVISVSILTAVYPSLVRAIQAARPEDTLDLLVKGIKVPAIILVPMTFAAIIFSECGIAVISPTMTPEEVHSTALVFSAMALGMVPFTIVALQQRLSMAREDGRTNFGYQMIVTGIQLVAAAVVVWLLPAHLAVIGVGVGQTVGNSLAAIVFLISLRRQFDGPWLGELIVSILRLTAVSILPAIAGYAAVYGIHLGLGQGYLSSLAQLLGGGVIFVAIFLGIARLAKIPELGELMAFFRRGIAQA